MVLLASVLFTLLLLLLFGIDGICSVDGDGAVWMIFGTAMENY
jgi:hypothetical protein